VLAFRGEKLPALSTLARVTAQVSRLLRIDGAAPANAATITLARKLNLLPL
jgi:hypothetical protein